LRERRTQETVVRSSSDRPLVSPSLSAPEAIHYNTWKGPRGGFQLEFEDEQDARTTPCEFTATSKATRRKFSVEAKHRELDEDSETAFGRFRVGRRLQQALRKRANHDRIDFIDINVPDHATDKEIPGYLIRTVQQLRRFEGRNLNGTPLPDAYLFVTNFPFHYNLDGSLFRCAVLAEGFQIADFKSDGAFPSLRHALNAREARIDMHRLIGSVREHNSHSVDFSTVRFQSLLSVMPRRGW